MRPCCKVVLCLRMLITKSEKVFKENTWLKNNKKASEAHALRSQISLTVESNNKKTYEQQYHFLTRKY